MGETPKERRRQNFDFAGNAASVGNAGGISKAPGNPRSPLLVLTHDFATLGFNGVRVEVPHHVITVGVCLQFRELSFCEEKFLKVCSKLVHRLQMSLSFSECHLYEVIPHCNSPAKG